MVNIRTAEYKRSNQAFILSKYSGIGDSSGCQRVAEVAITKSCVSNYTTICIQELIQIHKTKESVRDISGSV